MPSTAPRVKEGQVKLKSKEGGLQDQEHFKIDFKEDYSSPSLNSKVISSLFELDNNAS